MRLARLFAGWVDADADVRAAWRQRPSAWCASAPRPADVPVGDLDAFNERLLDAVNATGDVFLSHTRLNGAFVLRLAVGQMRTTEANVARAWELLQDERRSAIAADARRWSLAGAGAGTRDAVP